MKLEIVKINTRDFVKGLPKDTLHLLQGIHDKRLCYTAYYNGEKLAIIYNHEKLLKVYK